MPRPKLPPERVAAYVLSVRLTDEDRRLLAGLVELEQGDLEARGFAVRTSDADVVRGLIRQAARARGLAPAPSAEASPVALVAPPSVPTSAPYSTPAASGLRPSRGHAEPPSVPPSVPPLAPLPSGGVPQVPVLMALVDAWIGAEAGRKDGGLAKAVGITPQDMSRLRGGTKITDAKMRALWDFLTAGR